MTYKCEHPQCAKVCFETEDLADFGEHAWQYHFKYADKPDGKDFVRCRCGSSLILGSADRRRFWMQILGEHVLGCPVYLAHCRGPAVLEAIANL